MNRLIRFAFDQFYTNFAWTYDAVASAVSFGEWQLWGRQAISFLPRDGRILEIAHGPGHVHLSMREQGCHVAGIDLSPQMGRMALQRVRAAQGVSPALARASAMHLPFANASFAGAVSTFPAGFIFAKETLAEIRRVLLPRGRLVIVPAAELQGRSVTTRLVKFAYDLTGQSQPPSAAQMSAFFTQHGFFFSEHLCPTPRALVTVWVCDVLDARQA
jgi:ubiquinone/menaquinone biosynthesis C-methylase UbiE